MARVSLVMLTAVLPVTLCGTLETSEARSDPGAFVPPNARTSVPDALRAANRRAVRASDSTEGEARLAVDGRTDTAWSGRDGSQAWTWDASLVKPAHLGVIRTLWGTAPTSGIPTAFRWEVLQPGPDGQRCERAPAGDDAWTRLAGADQSASASAMLPALPTRRSWFVDADACGLRLVVMGTNAGAPVLREVQAIESARDVLRDGEASDDGASPGFSAADAIDGTYAHRWVGAPGQKHWMLRIDLPD